MRLDPGNRTATQWRKSAVTLASAQAQQFAASAYSYAYEGNYPKAIDYLTRAIELYPQADNYLNRGVAYLELGQHELAIQDYDESIHLNDDAIRLSPYDANYYGLQNADAYFYRGVSYAALDQHERAIQDYSEGMRLDPESSSATAALAYYNRNVSYQWLGMSEEAERDRARAKELGYKP